MTDPISDMLTRIRNAQAVRKEDVFIPYSNLKFELAKIFTHEGFIASAEKTTDKFPNIKVILKYKNKQPVIQNIKRISTPGRRVYASYEKIPVVFNGLGFSIISTSQGLMTNRDARKKKVGGEIVCEIY